MRRPDFLLYLHFLRVNLERDLYSSAHVGSPGSIQYAIDFLVQAPGVGAYSDLNLASWTRFSGRLEEFRFIPTGWDFGRILCNHPVNIFQGSSCLPTYSHKSVTKHLDVFGFAV